MYPKRLDINRYWPELACFSRSKLTLLGFLALAVSVPKTVSAEEVRFNRDVRSILSENCYACHGPDSKARKADLRLDLESGSLEDLGGYQAVVPGHPEKSELIARIETEDPDDIMPPPKTGKSLSDAEKSILREWILSGAKWEGHWSYIPVVRPDVPELDPSSGFQSDSPIDAFLARVWDREGVQPVQQAEARKLIRRLSLDLTGLPPEIEDVESFVNHPSAGHYAGLVDKYLMSPAFGERMAVFWLDLVRYADTVGYHGDQPYNVYPFRDYVIQAFNDNKPFDQFTREQIAGDLLPNPTLQQRIASGYNRLHMMTAEGGAQDKEYLAKYAADRIRTTGSAWLGSTMGCAECHDHKYDPITTRDFYSMQAFFADLEEKGFYGGADWGPKIPVPDPDQQVKIGEIADHITQLEAKLNDVSSDPSKDQLTWVKQIANSTEPTLGTWSSAGPFNAKSFDDAYSQSFFDESLAREAGFLDPGSAETEWTVRPEYQDGEIVQFSGDNSAIYVARVIQSPLAMDYMISIGSDDSIRIWLNGKSVFDLKTSRGVAPDQNQLGLPLKAGANLLLMKIVNGTGGAGFYFKGSDAFPENISSIARKASCDRTDEESLELAKYYRSVSSEWKPIRDQIAQLQTQKQQMEANIPTMLVSISKEPRTIRILPRGDWLNESGPVVDPAIPGFLGQLELGNRDRANRLDLANWLASKENPLTARTFVNRLWNLCFGEGLSKTLDDLGSQGAPPTHPDLMDWLAAEFMESGWDVKHVIRQITLSKAYQLGSTPTAELLAKDPLNQWLGRQNRRRLSAEFVRDNALKISGLLTSKIGGASVRPYQPSGYYSQLNFPKRTYQEDMGDDQYRRGVYTHWQRTFTHPSMTAFDAPSREECVAKRPTSNTPLQALVLLNDPSYVEAARVFAQNLLKECDQKDESRLERAFLQALSRSPQPYEVAALKSLLKAHLEQYQADIEAAKALLSVGQTPVLETVDAAELAAWTSVTQALLNLNETITRY